MEYFYQNQKSGIEYQLLGFTYQAVDGLMAFTSLGLGSVEPAAGECQGSDQVWKGRLGE